jgi:hypothetical protein
VRATDKNARIAPSERHLLHNQPAHYRPRFREFDYPQLSASDNIDYVNTLAQPTGQLA